MVTRNRGVKSFAGPRTNQSAVPQFKHKPAILQANSGELSYSGTSSSSNSCASVSDTAYLNKPGNKSQDHFINSHGSIFTLAANHFNSSQNNTGNQQVSYVQQTDSASSASCGASSLEQPSSHNYHIGNNTGASSATNQDSHENQIQEAYLTAQQQQQQQEQHRRLQFRVHQQLQRIYGSANERVALPATSSCHSARCPTHSAADTCKQTALQAKSLARNPQHLVPEDSERPYDSVNSINGFARVQEEPEEYFVSSAKSVSSSAPIQSQLDVCPPRHQARSATYSDRRAQLDELHYATATAAALLNATANAAAAIAVTAEKQRQHDQQASSLYSDMYQGLKKHHEPIDKELPPRQRLKPYPHAPEQVRSATDGSRGFSQAPSSIYRSALQSEPQIYEVHQQQQARARANHQLYQSVNMNRPALPPQPPARHLNRPAIATSSVQADLIRQHQQRLMRYQRAQIQQLVPPMRAFPPGPFSGGVAIVHSNKAKMSLKSELLSRMLFGNLMAANSSVASGENNYGHLAVMDKNRVLLDSKNNPEIVPIYAKSEARHTDAAHSLFPIAAAPSGDPRGTILLRRAKESTGIVERVGQIDLTLFWWSLLIVSFFFIGATVTISRYIY